MKTVLIFLLSLLAITGLKAQTESDDFITYDSAAFYSGHSGTQWLLRISRPRTDTNARPAFWFMPGAGEVGTDTNFLTAYGGHYWMLNGWTGAVQLGNGTHYPIIITVCQGAANTRGGFTLALVDTLLKYYHIKRNSVHIAGLSEGGWVWGQLIQLSLTAGDFTAMSKIRSFVNLEGVPANNNFSPNITFPTGYGHWAAAFGGRYFSLYGTNDTQHNSGGYSVGVNMNDSAANSAFTSFEVSGIGGSPGSHCCWNSMYDPSYQLWLTGPLVGSKSGFPNFAGNYTEPCSIFQWMLRQGDTSLVNACNPIVSAGSNQSFYRPSTSALLTGSVSSQCSNTITSQNWSIVSVPAMASPTITTPGSSTTTVTGMTVVGTYVFQLSATDNTGLTTVSNTSVTVLQEISPTVTAGGPYVVNSPSTSVSLVGNVTYNGGAIGSSTTWSYVSGPGGWTITSPSSTSTTITGLVQGTYVFQLAATDNNGNTSTSNATVVVNAGGSGYTGAGWQYALGEYSTFRWDSLGEAFAIADGQDYTGTGNSGSVTVGSDMPMAFPDTTKIAMIGAGLHGGAAIDSNGWAWSWGDGTAGQIGNGHLYAPGVWVYTPLKIFVDANGNPFGNIQSVVGFYAGNFAQGYYFVKNDGTLWITGDAECGMKGDGTLGDTLLAPVQCILPGGRLVHQIVAGSVVIVLCTDGTVWVAGGGAVAGKGGATTTGPGNAADLGYAATGNDYLSWTQLTTLSNIVQIAGGIAFNYALSTSGVLSGWGQYGTYLGGAPTTGNTVGPGTPVATPTALTGIMSHLPLPITSIVTNSVTTHAILTDGSLWGWGDNGVGSIGNGQELNFATYVPAYSWTFAVGQLLVRYPVQITPGLTYAAIYGSSVFNFFNYGVLTGTSQSVSWGRNKAAVVGNKIDLCSPSQAALYPNAVDQPAPTIVDPHVLTPITLVTCPICVLHPDTTDCGAAGCGRPSLVTTARAGSNQSIQASSTTLDGTGTTVEGTGGVLISAIWSQLSGPNTAMFPLTTGLKVFVTNLMRGTYTFQLTVTDNAQNVSVSTMTVSVGIRANYIILKPLPGAVAP